jgi:hypothetical protein
VAAIAKGLAKNPDERFQSVDELVGALLPFGPPGFMFGGSAPLSERPGLLTMGQLPLPQPPLVPSLHGGSFSSVPPAWKTGLLADPSLRPWILGGVFAVSILVLTALFVGLSGPPEASTDASAATAVPAAQPLPAAPVLSAPEPAAKPSASASSPAGAGASSKKKAPSSAPSSTSPSKPAAPKGAPSVGGDGTPLHL